MTETFYRQCFLKRVDGHEDVTWLPEAFANKGHFLKLLRNGVWENGWQVVEVYDRLSSKDLGTWQRDYLVQREASDV